MRLLFVSHYYWPEPFNITDMCETLVARGHDVTVLTGIPNYPEGNIYKGYEHGRNRKQTQNGVHIIRSYVAPRKRGAIHRLVNYESFSYFGSQIAKRLVDRFDAVIAYQVSPVMSANPGIAYAKKHNIPLLIYVIDIWPECLLAGGIKKGSFIYNYFGKISKQIYESADRIAVSSPLFNDYLADLCKKKISSVFLPQYAEDIFYFNETLERPSGYVKREINLTFAGNIGAAQSVKTIIEAAAVLREDDRFLFHIVGSGSELDSCQKLSNTLMLENVVFHGRRPIEEMPSFYNASDAMLASFSNSPILGYTLPRKIQTYLAAGKPIIGALMGESLSVVKEANCGFVCSSEDAKGFANCCLEFASLSEAKRYEKGKNARLFYEKNYSKQLFFSSLEHVLEEMKGI